MIQNLTKKINYSILITHVVHYSSQIEIFEDGAKNPLIVLKNFIYYASVAQIGVCI